MNQREIAKLAGVSTATVSRVVNGDVSVAKTTKEHVLKIIDQYSYVQNINARNLRASRSKALGFLISNFSNPFFIEVYKGLEPVCRKKGYSIIKMCIRDSYYECLSVDNMERRLRKQPLTDMWGLFAAKKYTERC